MLKKLLLGALLASVAAAAFASNVPPVSGPIDPANQIQLENQTIQAINYGVTGDLAATPAAVTTSGTTLQALFSYTLPGGQLSAVGQGLRIKAWGTNSADANAKTVTFAYGAATCALVVTGSGNTWRADFTVLKTGAATQTYECDGITSTTVVASVQGTGTNTDASATTISVSGTAATSGTMTLAGAIAEQLK